MKTKLKFLLYVFFLLLALTRDPQAAIESAKGAAAQEELLQRQEELKTYIEEYGRLPPIYDLKGVDLTVIGIQKLKNYHGVNFSGALNFSAGILVGKDLNKANFSGVDLKGTGIEGARDIRGANFSQAKNLPVGALVGKNLEECNFSGMDLRRSGMEGAKNLRRVNFSGALLPKDALAYKFLMGANFSKVDLRGTGIERASDLRSVDFSDAEIPANALAGKDLEYAHFSRVDLRKTGIEKATSIREVNFSEALIPPGTFEGKNLKRSNLSRVNLVGTGIERATNLAVVDFSDSLIPEGALAGKYLGSAIFTGVDLEKTGIDKAEGFRGANFSGSKNMPKNLLADKDLYGANFSGLDLRDSGIERARNLEWTKFKGATLPPEALADKDLFWADFSEVDLRGTGIERANKVRNVNFSDAIIPEGALAQKEIHGANFSGVDLTKTGIEKAKGLESAEIEKATFDGKQLTEIFRYPDLLAAQKEHFNSGKGMDTLNEWDVDAIKTMWKAGFPRNHWDAFYGVAVEFASDSKDRYQRERILEALTRIAPQNLNLEFYQLVNFLAEKNRGRSKTTILDFIGTVDLKGSCEALLDRLIREKLKFPVAYLAQCLPEGDAKVEQLVRAYRHGGEKDPIAGAEIKTLKDVLGKIPSDSLEAYPRKVHCLNCPGEEKETLSRENGLKMGTIAAHAATHLCAECTREHSYETLLDSESFYKCRSTGCSFRPSLDILKEDSVYGGAANQKELAREAVVRTHFVLKEVHKVLSAEGRAPHGLEPCQTIDCPGLSCEYVLEGVHRWRKCAFCGHDRAVIDPGKSSLPIISLRDNNQFPCPSCRIHCAKGAGECNSVTCSNDTCTEKMKARIMQVRGQLLRDMEDK